MQINVARGEGERVTKKNKLTLCTLLIMSTILDDPNRLYYLHFKYCCSQEYNISVWQKKLERPAIGLEKKNETEVVWTCTGER